MTVRSTRTPVLRLLAIVLAALVAIGGPALLATPSSPAASAAKKWTTVTKRAVPTGHVGLRVVNLNTHFRLGDRRFMNMMNKVDAQNPHVIFVQEVQFRDKKIAQWAKKHGYRYLWAKDDARQESTVLWKPGRFKLISTSHRLGSPALKRANGDTIRPRYIATVRLRDKRSGKRLSFSSTHAVPEVMWWPGQEKEKGAPTPFDIKPRAGTKTLRGFKRHIRAIRAQADADRSAGFISVIGADLNAGYEYESRWRGFQTHKLGRLLHSNHEVLGQIPTYRDRHGDRSIDYVYARRTTALKWRFHQSQNVPSDHHMITVDFAVAK